MVWDVNLVGVIAVVDLQDRAGVATFDPVFAEMVALLEAAGVGVDVVAASPASVAAPRTSAIFKGFYPCKVSSAAPAPFGLSILTMRKMIGNEDCPNRRTRAERSRRRRTAR